MIKMLMTKILNHWLSVMDSGRHTGTPRKHEDEDSSHG
jgi:hypothetical protein